MARAGYTSKDTSEKKPPKEKRTLMGKIMHGAKIAALVTLGALGVRNIGVTADEVKPSDYNSTSSYVGDFAVRYVVHIGEGIGSVAGFTRDILSKPYEWEQRLIHGESESVTTPRQDFLFVAIPESMNWDNPRTPEEKAAKEAVTREVFNHAAHIYDEDNYLRQPPYNTGYPYMRVLPNGTGVMLDVLPKHNPDLTGDSGTYDVYTVKPNVAPENNHINLLKR